MTRHVDPLLDEWLDDRLDAEERAAVERHLDVCPECRELRDALVETRRLLRESEGEPLPPAGLEERIRLALDLEDAGVESIELPAASTEDAGRAPRRGWLLAAAVLVATLAGFWLRSGSDVSPSPVDAAFLQYADLEDSGGLDTFAVASDGELSRRWDGAELGFEARVLDLSAMGIDLVGGGTPLLGERRAALSLYSADATSRGAPIACWMFLGDEAELPPPVDEHEERGFRFRIYERDGVTLVVWREGEVLCALALRGSRADVLPLAVGKAMAPVAV